MLLEKNISSAEDLSLLYNPVQPAFLFMVVERDLRQTAEKTINIQLKSGREITFPDKQWYRYTDVANALDKKLGVMSAQLHNIIKNDLSIQVATSRELKMLGILNTSDAHERSQTVLFNRPNLIRLLNIVDSPKSRKKSPKPQANISLINKDKKPKKPRVDSHYSWNNVNLSPENQPKPPKHPKEMRDIKDPKQILAINSVIKSLSHLANETLQQATKDLKEFLEEVATEHVQIVRFKDDPPQGIIKQILDSDLQNRLNRFFRVNLDAILDDLWDAIDTNERISKEEKIMAICKQLRAKGYDKEKAIEEICSHFGIQIPTRPESIVA